MMGLTDDRDISETVSETWSTDVLGSDFDPNMDEDRLQEIAGGASLCFLHFETFPASVSELMCADWVIIEHQGTVTLD